MATITDKQTSYSNLGQFLGHVWNDVTGVTEQREYQQQLQNQMNAYNSPDAQKARLMAAGYSERVAMDTLSGAGNAAGQQTTLQAAAGSGGALGALGQAANIASGASNAFGTAVQGIGQAIDNRYKDAENGLLLQDMSESLRGRVIANNWNYDKSQWEKEQWAFIQKGLSRQDIADGLSLMQYMAQLSYDPKFNSLWKGSIDGVVDFTDHGELPKGTTYSKAFCFNEKTGEYELTEEGKRQQAACNLYFDNMRNDIFAAGVERKQLENEKQDAENESASKTKEFENYLKSLDNETARLIAEGNIKAVRQKIMGDKDKPSWAAYLLTILEYVMPVMSGGASMYKEAMQGRRARRWQPNEKPQYTGRRAEWYPFGDSYETK